MHKGIWAYFGKSNQNPDLGILKFPKWALWSRNPVNPYTDYWLNEKPAKIRIIWENPKIGCKPIWSRNVKIQHGLLGEPGLNPDYLRNCTSKKWAYMIQECQSNTDWAIIRSAIHLLLKIRFQKKQAPPFSNGSQFGFFGQKKAKLLAQGPGRNKSRYRKKTLSNQGWHCFRFLCILLVPNALPKREPPQNVLRQGWLGHYYKSFPDNWNQVFLR